MPDYIQIICRIDLTFESFELKFLLLCMIAWFPNIECFGNCKTGFVIFWNVGEICIWTEHAMCLISVCLCMHIRSLFALFAFCSLEIFACTLPCVITDICYWQPNFFTQNKFERFWHGGGRSEEVYPFWKGPASYMYVRRKVILWEPKTSSLLSSCFFLRREHSGHTFLSV